MMKINADVYVKDVPGTLVSALDPISMFGGNIVGVFHNREQIVSGRILVNITFNIEKTNLERLKNEWKSRDVEVVRIGEDVEIISREYMFVGDMDGSDSDDIMEKIGSMVKVDSMEVGFATKTCKKSRAVIISAKLQSKEGLDELEDYLSKEAKKKNIIFIRGVEQ